MQRRRMTLRTIAIGIQSFEKIKERNYFYIDKTDFIAQWWDSGDDVTLIARPRRFGKTLNMRMVEQFFSVDYAGRSDLFEGLSIWNKTAFRDIQGIWPVLFLSFADIKETSFSAAREKICLSICDLYNQHDFLKDSGLLNKKEREFFDRISPKMEDQIASLALKYLSDFLSRYYGKKVIILLDEYDTPLQEYGLEENMEIVRKWYDGFIFGNREDIYNPWSVLNYLDTGKTAPYWANTSSNSLISKLIREGSKEIKVSSKSFFREKAWLRRSMNKLYSANWTRMKGRSGASF